MNSIDRKGTMKQLLLLFGLLLLILTGCSGNTSVKPGPGTLLYASADQALSGVGALGEFIEQDLANSTIQPTGNPDIWAVQLTTPGREGTYYYVVPKPAVAEATQDPNQPAQNEPQVPAFLSTAFDTLNKQPWGWALFMVLGTVFVFLYFRPLAMFYLVEHVFTVDVSGLAIADQDIEELKLAVRWRYSSDQDAQQYWTSVKDLIGVWTADIQGHLANEAGTIKFDRFQAFLAEYVKNPFKYGLILTRKGGEFVSMTISVLSWSEAQKEGRSRAWEAEQLKKAADTLSGVDLRAADIMNKQAFAEAAKTAASNLGGLGTVVTGLGAVVGELLGGNKNQPRVSPPPEEVGNEKP